MSTGSKPRHAGPSLSLSLSANLLQRRLLFRFAGHENVKPLPGLLRDVHGLKRGRHRGGAWVERLGRESIRRESLC